MFQMYSKVIHYTDILFFRFFSHIGHYRVLSRVPSCSAIQEVLIMYLFYTKFMESLIFFFYSWRFVPLYRLHLFHLSPTYPSPLATICLFSVSLSLFVFCFVCFIFYFFLFLFKNLFILFIFGCVGSLLLRVGFL